MPIIRLNNGGDLPKTVRRVFGYVPRSIDDSGSLMGCPCPKSAPFSGSLVVNAYPGTAPAGKEYMSHGMCLRTLIWCGAVACNGMYYTDITQTATLSDANADYIMRRAKYYTYFGTLVPDVTTFPVVTVDSTCIDHNKVSHTSWPAGADVSAHLPTILSSVANWASTWDVIPGSPHTLHLELEVWKWRVGNYINGPIAGRLLHKIDYVATCYYPGPCRDDCV